MNQIADSEKDGLNPPNDTGASAVAVQEKLTVGAGGVLVQGNVDGDIQIFNKRMEVHADHGAVVNIYDVPPAVKKRDVAPKAARPLRGFVNRISELKRLEQIITAGEAAALQAMEGMGKSALLRQAANSGAARALPDGVLFMEGVDEHGQVLGVEDVIQRLFDKSFESHPHLKVNFDSAQTYLGNLKSLVVLNGLGIPAGVLSHMPDLFSHSAVLMEASQSLDDDISEEIRLGPLPRTEAIELFAAKAALTPDHSLLPVLDEICTLLSHVPLALVIAARAIRENSLSLERARDILASVEPKAGEANRQGMERAYALAQSTLNELEKQWLAAAALAPGVSIAPEYLRQLTGDEATAEKTQQRLQAMGLLTANSPRLRIHPAFRDLARSGGDDVSLQERFLAYLEARLKTNFLDWEFCMDELGNILGMMNWAAGQGRWGSVISLGRGIDPYLTLHGLWDAWQAMIENVRRSARQAGDRSNLAWAYHQLGTHSLSVGLTGQAVDWLRRALALRRELGDTVGMAFTQHNLDLLIPPASSNEDNNPPDRPDGNPFIPNKTTKILFRIIAVIAAVAVSGYMVVNAFNAPAVTAEPDEFPVVAPIIQASSTWTSVPTKLLTFTRIPTKTLTLTPTKTQTMTPTKTSTPTLVPIVVTTELACSPTLLGLQNANCRLGPSKLFDIYGTLDQGQTVEILAVNELETWFLVDHPQGFRNPCWVSIGRAVEVQGDLSCAQVMSVPLPEPSTPRPPKDPEPDPPPNEPLPTEPPVIDYWYVPYEMYDYEFYDPPSNEGTIDYGACPGCPSNDGPIVK